MRVARDHQVGVLGREVQQARSEPEEPGRDPVERLAGGHAGDGGPEVVAAATEVKPPGRVLAGGPAHRPLEVGVEVLQAGIEVGRREPLTLQVVQGARQERGGLGRQEPPLVEHDQVGPVHGQHGRQRALDVGQKAGAEHGVDEGLPERLAESRSHAFSLDKVVITI